MNKVIPLKKESSNVSYVDFKNKVVVKTEIASNVITLQNPMQHFKPLQPQSNFGKFSQDDRLAYSQYIITNIKQMGFTDLLHFIDMGVLDQKKTAEALGIPFSFDKNDNDDGDEAS